jgi:hypothetical protein
MGVRAGRTKEVGTYVDPHSTDATRSLVRSEAASPATLTRRPVYLTDSLRCQIGRPNPVIVLAASTWRIRRLETVPHTLAQSLRRLFLSASS